MKKSLEKNVKSFFFIFTGLVLLTSYLMVIGNYQTLLLRTHKYKIILNSSEGLFVSSYASINGLRAGSVSQIELEGDKVVLTLAIKKQFTKFINQSSIASIKGAGILGDKYIYIETREEAPILPKGSFIKTNSEWSEINENILATVQEVVNEINVFLKELNQQEGDESVAKEIRAVAQQMNQLLSDQNNQNVQNILKYLGSILKKIDNGQGTLGALINNRELHNNAVSFLGQESYSNIIKLLFRK